jgi:hypothetical protein
MTALTAAERRELRAGLPRFGVFFHLAAAPPVRLWLGVGAIRPGVNAVDAAAGAVYRGWGEIVDVEAIQHLFDGTASRLAFTLSDVPSRVFAAIAPEIAAQQAAIQGRTVHVGWCAMGADWDMLGPIHWEWFGFADLIRVRHAAPEDAAAPAVWSVSLSCGDWLTGNRRPGLSFMSDPDQRARAARLNPTADPDRFFDRVGLYSAGVEKPWPPAT